LEGGERHEAFTYPDEQWVYYLMADKFGWTPEQVDGLPANTADWLLAISTMVEKSKAEKMNKQ
jgi:hypothetical protein